MSGQINGIVHLSDDFRAIYEARLADLFVSRVEEPKPVGKAGKRESLVKKS